MTEPTVNVENIEVASLDRRPVPAGISMPDHPIRNRTWYQLYVRLARPSLDWVTTAGVGYALIVGPAIQRPLDDGYLVQVLLFATAVFGVRSYEKVKGVA